MFQRKRLGNGFLPCGLFLPIKRAFMPEVILCHRLELNQKEELIAKSMCKKEHKRCPESL